MLSLDAASSKTAGAECLYFFSGVDPSAGKLFGSLSRLSIVGSLGGSDVRRGHDRVRTQVAAGFLKHELIFGNRFGFG